MVVWKSNDTLDQTEWTTSTTYMYNVSYGNRSLNVGWVAFGKRAVANYKRRPPHKVQCREPQDILQAHHGMIGTFSPIAGPLQKKMNVLAA